MNTETTRVEAFSDGVFAIAITLLILEIKVPSPGSGELAGQLLKQWPSYVSFAMSFAFIGIMWMNHHRLFTHIERCDNLLLVFNLLLLLGVTVVPFPTAVLAVHLGRPDQRTAVILFNATYVFIAVFFNVLWRYAASSERGLLAPEVNIAFRRKHNPPVCFRANSVPCLPWAHVGKRPRQPAHEYWPRLLFRVAAELG